MSLESHCQNEKRSAAVRNRRWQLNLDNYLSAEHRDNIAGGCPIAASASEIARHGSSLSSSFTAGFLQMVDAVESVLTPSRKKEKSIVAP